MNINWELVNVIMLGLLLAFNITIVSLNYGTMDKIKEFMKAGERYTLYDMTSNKTILEQTEINGLYNPNNDIYCVWEKGRTLSDIESTERHEYCHFLLDEGKCYDDGKNISCRRHFCI